MMQEGLRISLVLSMLFFCGGAGATAGTLKTHGIFSSNMVIQRDKPITIWGWAEIGHKVFVQLFGDVWVMNGQSNMAFALGATYRADMETAAFIRESQRLGLADLEDPQHTGFIPAYDQQLPGLHTKKKHFLDTRAARWAMGKVYAVRVDWAAAELVSALRDGEQMVLTFDRPVAPDDNGPIEGFAIASEDGKYYKAYAESLVTKDQGIWGNKYDRTKLFVFSPLVKEPMAVRYARARSPMGNLKVNGKPWQPLHSFRTDEWDWPENEDPVENAVDRTQSKEMAQEAAQRCERRSMEEAKRAVEILKQREMLGKKD